jgi:phosphoribosyl 1,2-cyclic phosphodiesterase
MKLHIIGSSSHGNAYILEGEKETLLLECGVHFQDIKKALNFNLHNVVGCLVSHSHKDHCKGVKGATGAGIDVYCSKPTLEEMGVYSYHIFPVETYKQFKVGSFGVFPFPLVHDVFILGFIIDHPESGRILFFTDTEYLPFKFTEVNQILAECNYDMNIVDANIENGAPIQVRNRVIQSHMGIDTLVTMLKDNDLTKVNNIILLHLSDGNSNERDFVRRVQEAAPGKTVMAANKNMSIDLNLTPF